MVTLLEPIGNELHSWQGKRAMYYLQASDLAVALCHALAIIITGELCKAPVTYSRGEILNDVCVKVLGIRSF